MDRYELPPALSIAYGDIDKEHCELIDTLNAARRLFQRAQNAPANRFHPFLRKMQDDMKQHFLHEEAEMAKLDYPLLAEHRLHHARCARRLDDICDAVFAGSRIIDKDLLDDLFDIIMDDVIRADSDLKSFLSAENLCFEALV
jgi:hemerythrin-like metal-binding protein